MKYYFLIDDDRVVGLSLAKTSNSIEVSRMEYETAEEKGLNFYVYNFGEIIENPEYEKEQKSKRQENFDNNFLSTSLGNFRLQPKGYANAQQSMDTVNSMVNAVGSLNVSLASRVIFYETPDFTKPEECTEEWLVAHQVHPEPMTKEEWTQFYLEFTTQYAKKMYQQELRGV